jgi:hypothetical protein
LPRTPAVSPPASASVAETRDFALHVMCQAEYGYIRSHPKEIVRIYNEWDFDGESLGAATHGQFRAMGEIGLIIYIEASNLK